MHTDSQKANIVQRLEFYAININSCADEFAIRENGTIQINSMN